MSSREERELFLEIWNERILICCRKNCWKASLVEAVDSGWNCMEF